MTQHDLKELLARALLWARGTGRAARAMSGLIVVFVGGLLLKG